MVAPPEVCSEVCTNRGTRAGPRRDPDVLVKHLDLREVLWASGERIFHGANVSLALFFPPVLGSTQIAAATRETKANPPLAAS